jgi:glutathione synthase/RimK-type ligase-like ATP-grasp enzyme
VGRIAVLYEAADLARNRWFAARLQEVGAAGGCEVIIVTTDEPLPRCDAVICRDRSVRRRASLEETVGLVVNPSLVALVGNDKLAQHRWLDLHGFPHPSLVRGPTNSVLIEKPRSGHGGRAVGMLARVGADRGGWELMVRERPVGTLGRSVRAVMLFGALLGAFARVHPHDFRANASLGAEVIPWSLEGPASVLVSQVAAKLGPGYYGIDLLFDGALPVVGEIEDVVGARSLWRLKMADPAEALMRAVASRLAGDR